MSDSAFAAAATFIGGLLAVLALAPTDIALYSLAFSGSVLAGVLPRQVTLIPIRTYANLRSPSGRRSLRADARASAIPMLIGVLIIIAAGLPMLNAVGLTKYAVITVTAVAAMVLGALQEHARAMLHVHGFHRAAMGTSAVSAASTLCIAIAGYFLLRGSEWIIALPFGCVAVGYLSSLPVYSLCVKRLGKASAIFIGTLRERAAYLVTAFLLQSVGYATNFLVLTFVGAVALATFESARVFAAPVLIVGTGLGSALKPRIIRAIGDRDQAQAKRGMFNVAALTWGAGLVYSITIAAVGQSAGDLLGRNVNSVLTGVRALSFVPESIAGNLGALHLAARRTRSWFGVSLACVLLEIALLVPALLLLGIYGPPIAHAASGSVRVLVGSRVVRSSLEEEQ